MSLMNHDHNKSMELCYVNYNSKQEVKFVEQCTRDEFETEHDCYKLMCHVA